MRLFMAFTALTAALSFTSCASVAYTDRKQINFISPQQEDQQGAQAFDEVKSKSKLSTDPAQLQLLNKVGKRISAAADKPEYHWEFAMIDDPKTVNAFCLPGGRVAFYTGILPITQDEIGMAVVMSHEVSHALAHHGAERMSQQEIVGTLETVATQTGLLKTSGQASAFEMAYGIGLGLPHSRSQEAEADRIGLILMAKAGYDPRAAVAFWQRMSAASGGKAPPEFLSTHPADATRIQKIQEHMPEALAYYKG